MRSIKRISALLLAVLMCVGSAACGSQEANINMLSAKSEDDSEWLIADSEPIILENDAVRFEMDPVTTHFTVTDLRNGKSYPSVPSQEVAAFSEEDQNRLRSELTVTFYEEQSTAQYMYSARDCVDAGAHEVRWFDGRVRVYYNMGAVADESTVPAVLSKEEFDSAIVANLEDPNIKRRLMRFYSLYTTKDESPDDYDDRLAEYPILKDTALYILGNEVSEVEKEEIARIMSDIGYDSDDYKKAAEKLGIDAETESKAGFTVPVEYALTEDGFTASVLSDKIRESSQLHRLQTVELLEYFGACDAQSEDRYVIPDGSGSVIRINDPHKTMYSQSFYGADYSVNESEKTQLTQNLMLPVCGISREDSGMLAVVETASEVAQLNIDPMSNSAPLNHIYVSFVMRTMDVTDIGKNMQVPVYNLFSKHLLQVCPKIRYVLLDGASDYVSMARYYREYLINNGTLKENNDMPSALTLDFLCMLTQKNTALGISYNSKIVLSTLSEITDTVKELHKSGVGAIELRLKGYGNGGLSGKAANDFSVDSKVGTQEELETLRKLLESNGGRLYLDADFQFVYSEGNGFSKKNDAAHYLNRTIVCRGDYDIVTREYDNTHLFRYFVSPSVYGEFAESFLSELSDSVRDSKAYGISYGSSGMYLGGDYASKDIDRVQSRRYLEKALENTSNTLMFDNGNAYILKFADRLAQVPAASSNFDMEESSIPFYQLVIHGYVPYSGVSENISRQPENALLKAVEYGSALSRTWITREASLLTNTEYELMYYSVNANSGMQALLKDYERICEYYEKTCNSVMVSHGQVTETVYKTVYENGISVLVNYGNEPAEIDNITVKANDFSIIYPVEG